MLVKTILYRPSGRRNGDAIQHLRFVRTQIGVVNPQVFGNQPTNAVRGRHRDVDLSRAHIGQPVQQQCRFVRQGCNQALWPQHRLDVLGNVGHGIIGQPITPLGSPARSVRGVASWAAELGLDQRPSLARRRNIRAVARRSGRVGRLIYGVPRTKYTSLIYFVRKVGAEIIIRIE